MALAAATRRASPQRSVAPGSAIISASTTRRCSAERQMVSRTSRMARHSWQRPAWIAARVCDPGAHTCALPLRAYAAAGMAFADPPVERGGEPRLACGTPGLELLERADLVHDPGLGQLFDLRLSDRPRDVRRRAGDGEGEEGHADDGSRR